MMSVLKSVGKGILYIIGLPFFLLILVGVGIAGIFVLIFMFFKSIILFFTGRSLDDELPEDRKARMIKEGMPATSSPVIEQPVYPNNPYQEPQPQPQQSSIEDVVFGQPEQKVPYTDEPQPLQEEESIHEERTSDEIFESILGKEEKHDDYQSVSIEPEKHDDEPIGEYIPHKSTQRIIVDNEEEEEEDNSATNIYFGGDND